MEHPIKRLLLLLKGGNSRNAIREKKRVWDTRIIPYQIPSYMSMYFCTTSPKEVTETLSI